MIFENYLLDASSKPIELIKHYSRHYKGEIEEGAVWKMENGKFLYLSFSGTDENQDAGVIDHQEFTKQEDAIELFESFYGL